MPAPIALPTPAECAELDAAPAPAWAPLAPGDLDRHLAQQPGAVGEAARERLAGAPAADSGLSIRERARQMLAAGLPALQRIAADPNASAAEVTAALAQIARIADAYSADGPATATARGSDATQLTDAELEEIIRLG